MASTLYENNTKVSARALSKKARALPCEKGGSIVRKEHTVVAFKQKAMP
jgi:hypothetical protein